MSTPLGSDLTARLYSRGVAALSNGTPVLRRSNLLSLWSFLRDDYLIRVDKRLEKSSLNYEERHPVIFAKNSLLFFLMRNADLWSLHGGPQLMHSIVGHKYCILYANSLIKKTIHMCVICARFKGATAQQQIGQLPFDRVRAARPFLSAGVDYAGPIMIRTSNLLVHLYGH